MTLITGRSAFLSLLEDEGIVRNRLKVCGSIKNARAFLAIRKELGSFDRFIWPFPSPILLRPNYFIAGCSAAARDEPHRAEST